MIGLALVLAQLGATASAQDTASKNKSIVHRYVKDVMEKGDLTALDELVATDFVIHNASLKKDFRGKESLTKAITEYRKSVPDLVITVDDLIAEGNKVAFQWKLTGTIEGPILGLEVPKGRTTLTGTTILSIESGKILEATTQSSDLARLALTSQNTIK